MAKAIWELWEDEWKAIHADEEYYSNKRAEFYLSYSFLVSKDVSWKERAQLLPYLGQSAFLMGWDYVRKMWKKPAVRRTLEQAVELVEIGYASQEFIALLIQILETRKSSDRLLVIRAFTEAEPVSAEIVEVLIKSLRINDPKLRQSAAFALVHLSSKLRQIASVLLDILTNEKEVLEIR